MRVPRMQLVLNDYVEIDWLRPLVTAGLDGLRIRIRDDSTRRLMTWTSEVRSTFPELDLVVNARLDIARALGLAVHLPAHGIPVATARRIAPDMRIGSSVHSVEEAVRAAADGADVVTFGHVFATASHPLQPPKGIDALAEVACAVTVPVVAIGGIEPGRVAAARTAGATGVASIGAITRAIDPARIVAMMIEEWNTCA